MKIDRSKLKKSSSEVPADCKNLIDKLKVGKNYPAATVCETKPGNFPQGCTQDQFLRELKSIETWTYGEY